MEAQSSAPQILGSITLAFSPAEANLWEYIHSQPEMETYIKSLIRTDMEAAVKSGASQQLRSYIDLMINTMDKDE